MNDTEILKGIKSKDYFENIEYIDVLDNGDSVYTFDGKEVEGLTKYKFQKMLGKMFGKSKTYTCLIKYKGIYTNKKVQLKSLIVGKEVMQNKNGNNGKTGAEFQKIEELEKQIETLSKQNPQENFNNLLSLTKITYESEISRLKESIIDLKNEVSEYKIENKQLLKDIYDLKNEMNEEESGGANELLSMFMKFNEIKTALKGGVSANVSTTNLNAVQSTPEDIPPEFLNALGKVDYSKVPKEDVAKYVQVFNQLANQLPLKSKEE